jgi:hypothetical protein
MRISLLIFFLFSACYALENNLKNIDNQGHYDTLSSDYQKGLFFFPEGQNIGTQFESLDKFHNKQIYDTREDGHHLSIAGNVHLDITKASDFTGFEFSYGFYLNVYTSIEFLLASNKTTYEKVADPNIPNAPPGETQEDLLYFGLGLGWRSDLIQNFIHWQNLFDVFTLYLTYNSLSENYFDYKYEGPGFRVDYLMKYRLTKLFHLGMKLSYSLAFTTRDQSLPEEDKESRRLTLGWTTLGLDLGINF